MDKRKVKHYFFAANLYEGCGHRHRTVKAARPCLKKIDGWRAKGIYKQLDVAQAARATVHWPAKPVFLVGQYR